VTARDVLSNTGSGGDGTGDRFTARIESDVVDVIRSSADPDHASLDCLRTHLYVHCRVLLEQDEGRAREGAVEGVDLRVAFARLQQPGGGFTYDLESAQERTLGFFVARPTDRARIYDASELQLEHLHQFAEANTDLLTRDGNLFGGWRDEGTGLVSLTISVQLDSAEAARLEAAASGQVAFYDAQLGTSVVVDPSARARIQSRAVSGVK
jgi:hypothetical protein